MAARYTRALSGELAGEEFQVPYCTHLNRYMLGGWCEKIGDIGR